MLHGYTHNQDDKAQLINDNLDVVKKIAFTTLDGLVRLLRLILVAIGDGRPNRGCP